MICSIQRCYCQIVGVDGPARPPLDAHDYVRSSTMGSQFLGLDGPTSLPHDSGMNNPTRLWRDVHFLVSLRNDAEPATVRNIHG